VTVTVVIPTIPERHDAFLIALDSVGRQTVEDVVVFAMPDGPDPDLERIVAESDCPGVRFIADHDRLRIIPLGRRWHPPGWGAAQRLVAGYLAETEYIAYLDDDNAWKPDHLEGLLSAIAGGYDFVFSQMVIPGGRVIGDSPVMGHIDTSMILHRTELLRKSTWDPTEGYGNDGWLAERWVAAGARSLCVERPTVIYRRGEHR